MIDRRKLLGAATLGTAGLAATACGQSTGTEGGVAAPAIKRKTTRLTMTTTWPKDLPGLGTAAQRVADRVAELSEGQLEIRVYAAGELVQAFGAFDEVASGNIDMYHGAEYYWQSKSKAFNFFTAVPMGMTAAEIMGWIDFGGGQALWEELSAQHGVIAFQGANTGHQMGGWFKKEIHSLDDFRGLKMRIPGLGGDVVRALGGAAEALAGPDIYQALQTGRIDATEWVGPWNDYFLGFHREAKFYYGPGFHEPGSSLAVGINKKKWDSLTPTEQAIIRSVCNETNHLSVGEFAYQNGVYLEKLKTEEDIELRRFPDDVMARVKEISADVRSDAGKGGDIEGRIYASFEDTLIKMRGWASISEGPYLAAREL
ncbi:MAG: TRAP transporter substrate-binding protein [Henriciella sp.]|nr:TRAP transporter substrate-binding protein [Henriciella sp.]